VNVEDQLAYEKSFLMWIKNLAKTRKNCPEIGWGTWHIQDVECPSMFVHICEWKGHSFLAMHNLSEKSCKFDLDLKHSNATELNALLGNIRTKSRADFSYHFAVPAFGYAWFKILKHA
jgi:maltose alpha-D-glucosyltransferase/alpha-amylase